MVQKDERPRLLVLASTYPRWQGDPEPGFVHELSRRLTDDFQVTVLCPHAEGAQSREIMDGIEVVRYRYAPQKFETLVNGGGVVTNLHNARWKWLLVPSFVISQAWMTWVICRRDSVEVIHAHWLIPQGLIAALIFTFFKRPVPFVVTSHGADLFALNGKVLNAIKRYVIRRAASVTVVSRAMVERMKVIGAIPKSTSVIPMGVDLAERFSVNTAVVRGTRELLFVGRLVEKKGVRHLIAALPQVLVKYPDVRLTIVGFGPEEAALKSQVERLKLNTAVQFLGAVTQSELPDKYRRASLFVAPFVKIASGDQEGLPVALMEAVACGCPVIVGDVAGIEDLLGEMKAEVCVDAHDSKALADKICQSLADGSSASVIAAKILAAAGQYVDWNRIAARYSQVIQSAIVSNVR